MGTYLHFEEINHPNILSLNTLFLKHYTAFRIWCLQEYEESKDWNENSMSESLFKFLWDNKTVDLTVLDQTECDTIIEIFTGDYCNFSSELSFTETFDPYLKIYHYHECTPFLKKHIPPLTLQLWRYLLEGRSILNNKPFISTCPVYRVGFLTLEEREHLYKALRIHLAIYSKKMDGVDYVCQALEQMKDNPADMITVIA